MLKQLFLPLLFLTTATAATAQGNCAKPVLKLLRNNLEIAATPSPLVAAVTLQVAPEPGCPPQSYRFRHAEITLVRKGRPALPTMVVETPQLDLRTFVQYYQTGDQLLVNISYQNLALVAPGGTLTPLLPAKRRQAQARAA